MIGIGSICWGAGVAIASGGVFATGAAGTAGAGAALGAPHAVRHTSAAALRRKRRIQAPW
jgi:hypothetical protein